MKEIEAKVLTKDFSIIERAGLILKKQAYVFDIYYDSPYLNFWKDDRVLRLRKENDDAFIAYKGPREAHSNLAVREEIEPSISSFEDGQRILKELNFHEKAKVEKRRGYYTSPEFSSLCITTDTYPFIGTLFEVEGSEEEVVAFLERYGFSLSDSTKKNCTELFLEHCEANNISFEKPELCFTFEHEEKVRDGNQIN